MKKVNITNCYCLLLTLLTLITIMCSVKISITQDDRINDLEEELYEIKKEVISHDYQSEMIQLQH